MSYAYTPRFLLLTISVIGVSILTIFQYLLVYFSGNGESLKDIDKYNHH